MPALFDSEEIAERVNDFQVDGDFLESDDVLASIDGRYILLTAILRTLTRTAPI